MRYTLEAKGFEVITGTGHADGLAAFRKDPKVRLLVIDVSLKFGSGIDLAKTIISEKPDIRILLTSGWDEQHIINLVDRTPFEYVFLPKPFTVTQFLSAVQDALYFRSARSDSF